MAVNSWPVSRVIYRLIRDTFDAEAKLIEGAQIAGINEDIIIYKTAGGTGHKITIKLLKENE